MAHSKRYQAAAKAAPTETVPLDTAIEAVQSSATEKFDSTVELHVRLGIDPKQSDQQVRGSVALPAGSGKTVMVAAVVSEAKEKEAKEAGADRIGSKDLIDEIKAGKLKFDVLVASPDMMPKLAQVAKVLGPRGLMPNPKTETVGPDVGRLITAIKAGKANFKNDEYGIVHLAVGKKSFGAPDLKRNITAALDAIKAGKPKSVKGTYLKAVHLTSTMGPSVRVKA